METTIRKRVKHDAHLFTHRPFNVPILYRDKTNTLLKELLKHNIIYQIDPIPHDKHIHATTNLSPVLIIQTGDSIIYALEARYLNSNTEHSDES